MGAVAEGEAQAPVVAQRRQQVAEDAQFLGRLDRAGGILELVAGDAGARQAGGGVQAVAGGELQDQAGGGDGTGEVPVDRWHAAVPKCQVIGECVIHQCKSKA